MTITIIDLVQHANENNTVGFDVVLFEDTATNRWMVATVDSRDVYEPVDSFCPAFDVEKLRLGKLVTTQYKAEPLVKAMKTIYASRGKLQVGVMCDRVRASFEFREIKLR